MVAQPEAPRPAVGSASVRLAKGMTGTPRRLGLAGPASGGGLAVAVTVLSSALAFGQSLPPLPELPLEAYEAGIREPIAEALRRAREKPEDAERSGRLGMLLYANEQYELAAACFERARALDPSAGRWAYYLGRAETYLARSDRAVSSLREALRHLPDYLPARLILARSLLEAGEAGESRALYEGIVTEHPQTAEAHYGLGRIAAAAGEPAAAAGHLRRACELFPGFGAAHYAIARAYRALGDGEKAREHLDLYRRDKLGWPSVPDPLLAEVLELKTGATARLRKGMELAEAGETEAAVLEHEAALAADPALARAHINLIRLYGSRGRPDKAEEHYRQAVALEPGLAEAHYDYGVLLVGQGRRDEALGAFARAVELNPSHAEAQNNYAFLLMTAGKLEEAARHYRATIASRPDHRAALFNLGRILVLQGRPGEAIEHLRQTLTPEDEETPRFTYALGAAYARAGEREQALRHLREAREKARARGQGELVASIEKDLRALEGEEAGPR